MESFDVLDIGVIGHEPSEGDGEIITKRALLSSLIFKIIDQLGVFSILASENLLEFENRGINLHSSVLLEDVSNHVNDLSSDSHLVGVEISSSFWWFHFKLPFFLLFARGRGG